MEVQGRKRIALVLCLLWAILSLASFYIISSGIFEQDTFRGQEVYWFIVLTSLLLLISGPCVFLKGWVGVFFPYVFMSKEDRSEYNMGKISFILGILTVIFSYIFLFGTIRSLIIMVVIIIVGIIIEVGGIYTAASDKFKVDMQINY